MRETEKTKKGHVEEGGGGEGLYISRRLCMERGYNCRMQMDITVSWRFCFVNAFNVLVFTSVQIEYIP